MSETTLQERIERFKKMGLPSNAGRLNPSQNQIPTSGVRNKNVLETLRAIKSGAKRQEFRETIKKMDKVNPGGDGYQIPETKQRKGPMQKPSVDVKVDNFTPAPNKVSAEAEAIERMFTGDGGVGRASSYGEDGPLITDTMSDYDINSELKQRLEKKSQKVKQNSPSANIDLDSLEQFIREIALEVSSKTIKSVLKEFLEKNKKSKEKEVEFYNKNKKIVKINNQLYKLVPVKIKDL